VIHTLSVLVENKPGALVRVCQMFARRGFNMPKKVRGFGPLYSVFGLENNFPSLEGSSPMQFFPRLTFIRKQTAFVALLLFLLAPAAAAQAPAAHSAPQLPFRYLGKAIEDGKLTVFLMKGNDSYAVHSKQALDNEYRVDKVTETQVVFTYVPLKQKQTLDIPVTQ